MIVEGLGLAMVYLQSLTNQWVSIRSMGLKFLGLFTGFSNLGLKFMGLFLGVVGLFYNVGLGYLLRY